MTSNKYYPQQKLQSDHKQPQTTYNPSPRKSPINHDFDFTDQTTSSPEINFYEMPKPAKQRPEEIKYTESIPLKRSTSDTRPQDVEQSNPKYIPSSPQSRTRQHSPSQSSPVKPKGFFSGRTPWFVYTISLVQITVFIVEIIKNSIITGSPIMIKPQFNPMIGPSTYVQISMGARFVPCMRVTPGVQDADVPVNWPCPNTTTSDPNAQSNHCDLKALCGFNGLDNQNPNQWFRFITPIFLHAGLVHIGFNMLLQLTMGREMEQAIGSIRFALVYFSSGIFGFVLGGNFAASAIASTGASGCLFGILALVLLDLIYCWNERKSPMRELAWIVVDIVISFVLGLLPGLDNFSHIGGFMMGLVAGICILHSPNILRERIGDANVVTPYRNIGSEPDLHNPKSHVSTATAVPADMGAFTKQPIGFFKGRKPLWWSWWLLRAGALIGLLVASVVLLNNFYKYHDTCSWCKYLSCLPINHWCDLGNLQLTNTTSSNNNNKRELAGSGAVLVTELWDMAGMR